MGPFRERADMLREAEQRDEQSLSAVPGQVLAALVGRGVVRAAQFVTFLILARMMSPADFGWFGILTTAIALASMMGSLGLRASLGYEIGQKHRTAGEAIGTALVLWLPLSVVAAAVVYLLYGHELPSLTSTEAAAIVGLGVATSLLVILLQGVFLGRGEINAFALSETAPRIGLLALTVLLLVTAGITLRSALWAYSGGFLLALPIIIWLASRGTDSLAVNFSKFGATMKYGVITAINLLLITLCARISMFVIEHFSGAAAAGQFFAAARVNEIFMEAATAVGMVLFSNAARREDSASTILRNARIGCWMFWIFLLLGAVIAITSPSIITLLAGSEYSAAGPALQLMAISLAPTAASKVIYPSLSGSGHPHFGTPILIGSVAVNAAVAVLLVPSLGMIGGAIALVVGQYLLFIGYVASCRLRFNVPVRDMIVPRRDDARASLIAIRRMVKLKRP